jgi:hypothetical protein
MPLPILPIALGAGALFLLLSGKSSGATTRPAGVYPQHHPAQPGDTMGPMTAPLPPFPPGVTAADVSDDDPRSPNYDPTKGGYDSRTDPRATDKTGFVLPYHMNAAGIADPAYSISARMLPPQDPRSAFTASGSVKGARMGKVLRRRQLRARAGR